MNQKHLIAVVHEYESKIFINTAGSLIEFSFFKINIK